MAHAGVVSTIQVIDQIIIEDQFHTLSIKQEIKNLREKFYFLQSSLEDECQETSHSLETRIREISYRAHDMIMESNQENQSVVMNHDDRAKNPSWRLLHAVQNMMSLHSKPRKNVKKFEKLHNVVDEVDWIVGKVMKINQTQRRRTEEEGDLTLKKCTNNFTSDSKTNMVGFEEDFIKMKDELCGRSSSLQLVPIVGMGGIGKTTLATHLYRDPLIAHHFHICAWTTITQRYNMREILLALLTSLTAITEEKLSRETDNGLALCLYKTLKGRRYLIVLDDMWNTEVWDRLKMLFPDDHNGSRIMLTTRLVDVASYANSCAPFHQVQFLNEDQSWELLQDKVFGQEECCPPELEEIGKLIAKNCRGLPLSIIVVGGILSRANKIRYRWENTARDVISAVRDEDDDDRHLSSSKILSLSYNHLPHHLRACFLYLGAFPEGYEIPVFKLITLWVAEGFLKLDKSKSPEEVAEEYLEDLVKRSLVLITKKTSSGRFRFCSIHNMLRDLCIRKSREENFLHSIDGMIEHKRRLCFLESDHLKNASTDAGSIFCRSYNNDMLTGFRLLRVLDILQVCFEFFPVEILHLSHLRYVAFSTGFIRCCMLPPLLPKLRNLQTLIIGSSVTFSSSDSMLAADLPIWNMPKLRHLVFLNITLSPLPFPSENDEEDLPVLENLQTLSRVRNFKFTRAAIDMIPNLKKLKVLYTGGHRLQGGLDNLVHLQQLETLNLEIRLSSDWWRDPIPLSFELPLKLKKLTMSGCGLSWKDMTKIGCLPNLQVLKLLNLSVLGLEWEPVEGEFTSLKFLLMEWLDLKCWLAERNHFPRLERLVIRHCSALESIPCEIGEIPTLQVIEVELSKMAADSARLILEDQREMGNDDLQVRVV